MDKKKSYIIVGIILLVIAIALFVLFMNKKAIYTVEFNTDGGTVVELQEVKDGEKATRPINPTKTGYSFDAWYLNGNIYDFNDEVKSNLVLIAKWTASANVEPNEVKTTNIAFGKTKLNLEEGASETLSVTFTPSNATDKTLTWKSSNEKVAKVDANGKVTAISSGSATITATTKDNQYKATCTATVTAKKVENTDVDVTGISLNKTTLSLIVDSTDTLKATVLPNNATNKNVSWKSSDTSIATVTSSGKVTAKKAGTVTITVTTNDGSYKKSCAVTVTAKETKPVDPIKVTGITASINNTTLNVGGTANITASVEPTNADNKAITYTSSNTSVATVNSDGNVTAIASGTATITAKSSDGAFTKDFTITVKDIYTYETASYSGNTIQYKVLVYKNGTNVTSSVENVWSWSSGNINLGGYSNDANAPLISKDDAGKIAKVDINGKFYNVIEK